MPIARQQRVVSFPYGVTQYGGAGGPSVHENMLLVAVRPADPRHTDVAVHRHAACLKVHRLQVSEVVGTEEVAEAVVQIGAGALFQADGIERGDVGRRLSFDLLRHRDGGLDRFGLGRVSLSWIRFSLARCRRIRRLRGQQEREADQGQAGAHPSNLPGGKLPWRE